MRWFSPLPAVGAEASWAPPLVGVWRLLSLILFFTTSATVADRRVRWRVAEGDLTAFSEATRLNQPASQSWAYAYAHGVGEAVIDTSTNRLLTGLPELYLFPGNRIVTVTTNLQAGDSYDVMALLVEELPEPPRRAAPLPPPLLAEPLELTP